MRLAGREAACVALAVLSAVASGCGGGGEKTTQELVDELLAAESREERIEIANELAPRADAGVVRAVARSARSGAALSALRDSLIRVYRVSSNAAATRTRSVRAVAAADDDPSIAFVVSVVARDRNSVVRNAAADALVERRGVMPLIAARERGGQGKRAIEQALVRFGARAADGLLHELAEVPWARSVVAEIGDPALPALRQAFDRGGFELKVDAAHGLLVAGTGRDVRRVVSKMMDVLGGSNDSRRFTAMEILAEAGRPTVDAIVPIMRRSYESLDAVEKKQWEWGIQLLVDTNAASPKATRHLFTALRTKQYDLVAAIHMFYIRLGRAGTETGLVDALNAQGDTIMALNFLNSGNAKLDRGARGWAAANGYTVTSRPGQGPPASWGTG